MNLEQPELPYESSDASDQEAVLAELRVRNANRLQALARDKVGLNPAKALEIRLSLLIDRLVPEGSERIRFEIEFESAMADIIDQIESEVTRVKLTAPPMPVQGPNGVTPGLFIPPPGGRR